VDVEDGADSPAEEEVAEVEEVVAEVAVEEDLKKVLRLKFAVRITLTQNSFISFLY
jgi:hypothetical protein